MIKARILATVVLVSGSIFPLSASAENLDHTRQLLATKQCQKCELSGAGLVLANLAGSNLAGANLNRANLSRADLSGADLSGADLRNASLYGANLSGANLRGANLTGADLRDAILVGADTTGVILAGASVRGTTGLGEYQGRLENLYEWGMEEGKRKNYPGAIAYFNEALTIKPDFAPAYLGRAASRAEMGDYKGALQDAQYAGTLYTAQNNPNGTQTSELLVKQIEAYQERASGNTGGGGNIINVLGSVLLQLLF